MVTFFVLFMDNCHFDSVITQIPKKQGMGFESIDSFLYHIPDNPSPPNSIKLTIQVNKGYSKRITNYAKKTSIISLVSAKLGNSIKSEYEMLELSILMHKIRD
jgi:hypothetical protein